MTRMKTYLLACCFLPMSLAYGQNIKISGRITDAKSDSVRITYYDHASNERTLGEARLDKAGGFNLGFQLTRATFVSLEHGNEYSQMFLTPGDSLFVTLDTKKFDESISYAGKGAEANNFLAKKVLAFDENKDPAVAKWTALRSRDEAGFLKYCDSVADVLLEYYEKHYSPKFSEAFSNHERGEIEYGAAYDKLSYHGLHAYLNGLRKSTENKDPHYYDFLRTIKIDKPEFAYVSAYMSFLESYLYKAVDDSLFKEDTVYNAERAKKHLQARYGLAKARLSGAAREHALYKTIYNSMSRADDVSAVEPLLLDYRSLKPDTALLAALDKVYAVKSRISKGKPAIGFTYPDVSGKNVSLADFKGKIVYVDFWASWCGPCRREMPYAKKLVEKYGRDIVFLFVSIDENEAAWKKAMQHEKINGIHLLAKEGFESQVLKDYGIAGIPHYLLIDKQGNIISGNAARPSGGIEKAFEEHLTK